jgi:hypothetical protein
MVLYWGPHQREEEERKKAERKARVEASRAERKKAQDEAERAASSALSPECVQDLLLAFSLRTIPGTSICGSVDLFISLYKISSHVDRVHLKLIPVRATFD